MANPKRRKLSLCGRDSSTMNGLLSLELSENTSLGPKRKSRRKRNDVRIDFDGETCLPTWGPPCLNDDQSPNVSASQDFSRPPLVRPSIVASASSWLYPPCPTYGLSGNLPGHDLKTLCFPLSSKCRSTGYPVVCVDERGLQNGRQGAWPELPEVQPSLTECRFHLEVDSSDPWTLDTENWLLSCASIGLFRGDRSVGILCEKIGSNVFSRGGRNPMDEIRKQHTSQNGGETRIEEVFKRDLSSSALQDMRN